MVADTQAPGTGAISRMAMPSAFSAAIATASPRCRVIRPASSGTRKAPATWTRLEKAKTRPASPRSIPWSARMVGIHATRV